MRAVLVDDDADFCKVFLKHLQGEIAKLNIKLECDVCCEPEKILQQSSLYDVYILDIEMDGMNGLDLAIELRNRLVDAEIIFLSFHEQYVWKTFYVRPGAFIRKARMDIDLPEALQFIVKQNEKNKITIEIPINESKSRKIKPIEVMYCRSEEHYVKLIWKDGQNMLFRMKLGQAEQMLQGYGFVRTHSRYLVNLKYIRNMSADKIILIDGQMIPVSRAHKRKVQMIIMNMIEQKRMV